MFFAVYAVKGTCRIVRQSKLTPRRIILFFPKLNNRNCGKILTVTSMKTQMPIKGLHTMMKRNALWALLAVGMAVVSTGVVNAQWLLPKVGLLGEFRKKSIVGSWEELVRFPPGVPISQQRAVMSFHDDGTVVSSGQGSVMLNPPPGSVESDGLGDS